MDTMKKIIVFCFLFLLFLLPHNVRAEQIESLNSHILVNKDGTVDVKESIVYDFGDLDRHGIYRAIPVIKKNKENKKFKMNLRVDSVLDEKGTGYAYRVINSGDELQVKIGDPNRTITGVHTYVISYKVYGALTYFSDHDELYWNVTGNQWKVPIVRVTADVILPSGTETIPINGKCYTGQAGSQEAECEIKKNGNQITFDTVNNLTITEGFTIVAGFPKNIVAVLEPKEYIPFYETVLGKLLNKLFSLVLILLATFWYLIYPIKIMYKWFRYGRDPKGMVGEARAWFDPPKIPSGKRFMTPAEVGTLGDETVDLKDISAMIIDLARKGYLRIEERKKNDFYFVRRKDKSDSALLDFEKKLLSGIFEYSDEIRLKDKELYEIIEGVKKSLYEDVIREGLFPKNPQSIRTFYSAIGGIALATMNFFLAASAFLFGRNMPQKTVEGANAFNVAKSLKNFLTSQERQLTFQADKQMFFEKLLPYAVAFGVEKIWAKRFETMNLKEPDWYRGYGYSNFNSVVLASSLNSSFSSFRSAATPTSSSSGFSSAFSGGSSGGGGGGGGGGSW